MSGLKVGTTQVPHQKKKKKTIPVLGLEGISLHSKTGIFAPM